MQFILILGMLYKSWTTILVKIGPNLFLTRCKILPPSFDRYWPGQISDSLFCCHSVKIISAFRSSLPHGGTGQNWTQSSAGKDKIFPLSWPLYFEDTRRRSSERPPPPRYYQNDWLHLQLQQIFLVISLIGRTVREEHTLSHTRCSSVC